jgi:RNA recognition motif-containing protein
MNIFTGSLPFKLQEDELRKAFEEYGEVSSVKIITDKYSGRSKGFGFVEMPDDEAAQKAIDALNGTDVGGRAIVVNKSEERKEGDRKPFRKDNNRGGGGGYNRGGGGGGYNSRGGDGGGGNRW